MLHPQSNGSAPLKVSNHYSYQQIRGIELISQYIMTKGENRIRPLAYCNLPRDLDADKERVGTARGHGQQGKLYITTSQLPWDLEAQLHP